jgi:hypothetical protein
MFAEKKVFLHQKSHLKGNQSMTSFPVLKKRFITCTTVLFIIEIIVMQFIYSSFDFYMTPLSVYGTGKYGLIICSGLILIGINYLLLFHGFHGFIDSNSWLKSGTYLLFIVGASVFFIACFQTDIGRATSLRGHIHVIAAHIHFIVLPYSSLLILIGIRKKQGRFYKIFTLLFSIVCFVAVTALGFKDFFHSQAYDGLIQKSLIMVILIWIIFSGQYIYNNESEPT